MAITTDQGMEDVARLINNVSPNAAYTYIATGSASTAESATQTSLGAENTQYGGQRQAATCEYEVPFKSKWEILLSFNGPVSIREIGLFNNSSAGRMFMRHVYDETMSKVSGQNLKITIYYTMVRV